MRKSVILQGRFAKIASPCAEEEARGTLLKVHAVNASRRAVNHLPRVRPLTAACWRPATARIKELEESRSSNAPRTHHNGQDVSVFADAARRDDGGGGARGVHGHRRRRPGDYLDVRRDLRHARVVATRSLRASVSFTADLLRSFYLASEPNELLRYDLA